MILPGPPHELKSMFTRHCLPRLQRIVPPLAIRTLELRISGMSESELDQAISPIYKHYSNPVTTILAHNGDMQVHLRARCATEGETMHTARGSGRQDRCGAGRPDLFAQRRSAGSGGRQTTAEPACHAGGCRERHRRRAGRAHHERPRQFGLVRRRLHHLHAAHEDRAAGRSAGNPRSVRRRQRAKRPRLWRAARAAARAQRGPFRSPAMRDPRRMEKKLPSA